MIKEVDYTALLIKEGFPEDTGSYAVVIRNALGEARSFTQLIVEEFFCRTPSVHVGDERSGRCFPSTSQGVRNGRDTLQTGLRSIADGHDRLRGPETETARSDQCSARA